MRKRKMKTKLFPVLFLLSLLGTSCIQEEPLNPEADILSFGLPESIIISEPMFNQNDIFAIIRSDADMTNIAPEITVTDGATIVPASGTPQDFSQPVVYTVTAADGIHQRVYTVQLTSATVTNYTFEYWSEHTARYETPYELNSDNVRQNIWASSNQGMAIYQQFTDKYKYPVHSTTDAVEGTFGAYMETQNGPGNILNIQYIPIIAGSLFTGSMDLGNALLDPLSSTKFGIPFTEVPIRFKGYYKYKAGTGDYIGPDGNPRPGVIDSCALYAVFYKIDENLQSLDGNTVLDHPNIVSMAMLPDKTSTEGDEFVSFDIPFAQVNDIEVDFDKYTYKLAVVLSSSFWGQRYEGTPGSNLTVDNLEIITENEQ